MRYRAMPQPPTPPMRKPRPPIASSVRVRSKPRLPEALSGRIWIPDDFSAFPADMFDAMEEPVEPARPITPNRPAAP